MRTEQGIAIGIGICAAAASVVAQTWVRQTPPASPPARSGHCMVFDAVRNESVVFGGFANAAGFRDDTWTWNALTWTRRLGAAPPARRDAAMVFDLARGRAVLFGGAQFAALADTWEWDGNAWTRAAVATAPPARSRHAMAFDSARGRTVLFGGENNGALLGDTWEWDGVAWLPRAANGSPPARFGHAMAFDTQRGRTVLFGGVGSGVLGDTWEWDGQTWLRRTPAASPPPRYAAAMVHDQGAGRCVLFSGDDGVFPWYDDLWIWDGATWLRPSRQQRPAGRDIHAMAYDSLRQRIVLFGGYDFTHLDDTWDLDLGAPLAASATPFGSGCAAAVSAPPLTLLASGRPTFGSSVVLVVQNAPLGSVFVLLGWSDAAMANGRPLPFPLTASFAGCELLVSAEFSAMATATAPGTAQMIVPVPTSTSLRGLRAFAQGWAPASGPVALPMVVSNGIELVLGS